MKYTVKILVLFAIFIASIYFFGSNMDEVIFRTSNNTIMASEAELPTIEIESEGVTVNQLYGYISALDMFSLREHMVAVQENQIIELVIQENDTDVRKLHYKIKSVSTKEEIADGTINAFNKENEQKKARIKIADKLTTGEEYAVEVMLVDSESRRIYYYFRMKYYPDCYFEEKVSFMEELSTWTREKNEDALKKYMESTYKGAGSTFASVNIKDSLYMICWGDLQPKLLTEPVVTIAEIYTNIAVGALSYMVELETPTGVEQYYVNEKFRVNVTGSSKHLLNYERTMESVFDSKLASLSQSQLKLGITNDTVMDFLLTSDASILVFIRNKELWQYNMAENQLTKVFSFRKANEAEKGISSDQYDIQVLKLYENGDISFMVSGYMGKGEHEGRTGLILYRYYRGEKRIEEQLYVPVSESYQRLKEEIGTFRYITEYDEIYFMIDGALYSYNLITKKLLIVSENVKEERISFFEESAYIAWQEDYSKIRLLYLETGETKEILAGEGEFIRILGEINENIICAYGRIEDCAVVGNGTTIYPAYLVKILDASLQERKSYQKEEVYVTNAEVTGGSICLYRVKKSSSGNYTQLKEEYILHSMEEKKQSVKLEKRVTDAMFTEYYIDLPSFYTMKEFPMVVEELPYTLVLEDTTAYISDFKVKEEYSVYSFGKLLSVTEDCAKAISLANETKYVGTVVNEEGKIIWERGVKSTNYSLKEPKLIPLKTSGLTKRQDAVRVMADYMGVSIDALTLTEEQSIKQFFETTTGKRIISLTGSTLDEVLYFVYKGTPVIAMKNEKEAVVIIGYTSSNVILYEDGKTKTVSLSNAETMFLESGNIFFTYKE